MTMSLSSLTVVSRVNRCLLLWWSIHTGTVFNTNISIFCVCRSILRNFGSLNTSKHLPFNCVYADLSNFGSLNTSKHHAFCVYADLRNFGSQCLDEVIILDAICMFYLLVISTVNSIFLSLTISFIKHFEMDLETSLNFLYSFLIFVIVWPF